MIDVMADEIMRSLLEKVNKQIADDVIKKCMADIERANQKRRAAMSNSAHLATGFQARAFVRDDDGAVLSLTGTEEGKKRKSYTSTPVWILTEERYLDLGDEINARAKIIKRVVEMMNDLASDLGPRDPHLSPMHYESPRREVVQAGADLEKWNKACDETIARHRERQKALADYHDKERQRNFVRDRGGIFRTIIDVIETLEALTESCSHQKGALTIEQVSGHEETVIKIRIPSAATDRDPSFRH